MEDNILLEVKNLRTTFYNRGSKIEAVRGVDLHINHSEILGIVGESGSGKSVLMKSVMGIIHPNAKIETGEIFFQGKDIVKLSNREKEKLKVRILP